MKKNKQLQKTIGKLVEVSFKDGRIMEGQVIRSARTLKSLPAATAIQTLSEYLNGLKRKEKKHTAYVETAVSLSPAQLQKVKRMAKETITKISVKINKDIVGGFKLTIGDDIWDGSVLGRMNQVMEVIHG